MTVHRYSTCACLLALLAALPWPALVADTRAAADTPKATTAAAVLASDHTAVIAAIPAERKPVSKGERVGLDGAGHAVATLPCILAARASSPVAEGHARTACVAQPTCAFLCRFLV
jgi:uncharacterized protein involved in copper resistance